jgi:ligand-binding sensor domain-containing protein
METPSRNSVQILEDKAGRIYINTSVSLCRYDEDRETFVDLLSLINNGFSIASHCFITPSNDLLLASSMSIKMFDVETMQLKDSVAVQNYPGYYAMMKDGRLWMSSYAGLAIYNTNTFAFEEVPEIIRSHPELYKSSVSYMCQYGEASIIFNTDKNGLFLYNKAEGTFRHQSENGFPFAVPDVKINCMFEDSRNNLWIGSYDQGYYVIYDYQGRFNNDSWLKSNIGHKSVVSVDADSHDNLWISTLKDGLYLYNADSELFRRINLKKLFNFEGGDRLDISYVFVDKDDKVWLTGGSGVCRCNFDGHKLSVENSWPVFIPLAMSQDSEGRVWIGAMGEHIYYVSPEDDQIHSFKNVSAFFTFTPYCLPMNDGNILSASFQTGLTEMDAREKYARQITIDENM